MRNDRLPEPTAPKMHASSSKRQFGNYTLIQQIGCGAFSSVWLGKHNTAETDVAIKVIKKRSLATTEAQHRFSREVTLLKNMNHMFVVEFFEFLENEKAYGIVMEYVENGNLRNKIAKSGKMSEAEARFYFTELVSCLEYLHDEKNIIHRDLKMDNVLIDKYGNIRVIDFGLSNVFCAEHPKLVKACGSLAYVAPEMLQGLAYTKSADVWSAGVLLYAIVVGSLPFDTQSKDMLCQMVLYTEPYYPPFLSASLVDLLKKMLSKSADSRITLAMIKEHPWFSHGEYVAVQEMRKQTARPKGYLNTEIVDRMKALGLNCQELVQNLMNDEFTEVAAVYRMFLHQDKLEQMKSLVAREWVEEKAPDPEVEPMPAAQFSRATSTEVTKHRVAFGEPGVRRGSHQIPERSLLGAKGNLFGAPKAAVPPRDGSRMMHIPAPVQLATKWMAQPGSRRRSLDTPAQKREGPRT